ncbi:MAG: sigma-54 dependent transcriptional regulator [bacterium]|jgi:two-component system nitrogen regulation response regulator NtrX
MAAARLLIIDDEPEILKQVSGLMEDEGYRTVTAAGGEAGVKAFSSGDISLVLLDVYMPGMDGLAVLEKLKEIDPGVPVIMVSGQGSIEVAVKATKLGAIDFVEKPFEPEELLVRVRNALELQNLRSENIRLAGELRQSRVMVGRSELMRALEADIAKAAPSKIRVLITGENGTGKELVASAIHENSPRSDRPFVKLNCAALPKDLIESELFGYEKGAFTGATTRKQGKFELADGGTLLLDEIGDMSLDTQAKLLRVLEEEEFEKLGGRRPLKVDVRVISSTNKNLQEEIKKGNFREDLYHRIAAMPIAVPSLRERKDDIPLLVEHFLEVFRHENNRPEKRFTEGAVKVLMSYDWPGNVRELKNLVERLVIMSEAEVITEDDIKPLVSETRIAAGDRPLSELTEEFERSLILSELNKTGWNVSKAASRLGIDRANLHRKMRRYGIHRDGEPGVSGQEA